MRPHVLVLEPNRELRDVLVDALLYEGFVVAPAPTQAAALVALRPASEAQLPEVVLLDAEDDRDLVAELRRDTRYAPVGIVALSFGVDPLPEADVDLRRPYRLDDVVRAVRVALARRGHAAAARREPEPWAGERAGPNYG